MPFDAPPAPRGHPWPAWCAIFIMIAIQQVSAFFVDEAKLKSLLAGGGSIIGQIEGRLLVGIRQLGEDLGGDFKEEFQEKIQTNLSPHQGPVRQRLQAIAIVGELSGTTGALPNLFELRESIEEADHQLTDEES